MQNVFFSGRLTGYNERKFVMILDVFFFNF